MVSRSSVSVRVTVPLMDDTLKTLDSFLKEYLIWVSTSASVASLWKITVPIAALSRKETVTKSSSNIGVLSFSS